MVSWRYFRRATLFTAAIAVAYLSWVFLGRYWSRHHINTGFDNEQARRNAEFTRTYGGSDVKILQFYAREGNLAQGRPTVLCYGVLNARTVRIDPEVEGVSPALSRCVEVAPLKDTRYTLTADDGAGHAASESLFLKVRPDEALLPRITYFQIASHKLERGRHLFMLTFGDANGEEISIDPPVFPTLHGAPNGQFLVAPEKTTTYTLTVKGKFGHRTQRQLTLEVPPGC